MTTSFLLGVILKPTVKHCSTAGFLSFILLTVFFLNSMLFLIAMAITSHVVLENTTD